MFHTRRITTSGGDKFRDEHSLSFDGSDDYVALGTAFSHNVHTIATWVKVTADSDVKSIFDARDANNDGIYIYIGDDGIRFKGTVSVSAPSDGSSVTLILG